MPSVGQKRGITIDAPAGGERRHNTTSRVHFGADRWGCQFRTRFSRLESRSPPLSFRAYRKAAREHLRSQAKSNPCECCSRTHRLRSPITGLWLDAIGSRVPGRTATPCLRALGKSRPGRSSTRGAAELCPSAPLSNEKLDRGTARTGNSVIYWSKTCAAAGTGRNCIRIIKQS
jgi:hypothetical protein